MGTCINILTANTRPIKEILETAACPLTALGTGVSTLILGLTWGMQAHLGHCKTNLFILQHYSSCLMNRLKYLVQGLSKVTYCIVKDRQNLSRVYI